MYHVSSGLSRKKFIYFLLSPKVQVLTPTSDEPDLSPRSVLLNELDLIVNHFDVLGLIEELVYVLWCVTPILATCFDVCL